MEALGQALQGKPPGDMLSMTDDVDLRAQIQRAISRVNTRVSRAESIRAFRILPNEFSMDDGLLTPTLKLKRRAITGAYAADIDALYTR